MTLVASATAWPRVAHAQQQAMSVIGFLSARSAKDSIRIVAAFGKGLEEAGFTEGKNLSTEYRFADGIGRIGFIASVSRPFCLNCNRIRRTADGHVRYCLFAIEETDVRGLIRGGASDEAIAEAIRACVSGKWIGHQINSTKFIPPPRPMYSIGG